MISAHTINPPLPQQYTWQTLHIAKGFLHQTQCSHYLSTLFFFFFFFFKFKFWFDYYLHTIYLGKLCPHQYFVHTLSPVTDNCPSWISGRGRLTEEMISWSTSAKNWAGILTCGTWICSQMCYWVCYGAHPPYLSKFKTHWWTWLPSTDCASAGDVDTI